MTKKEKSPRVPITDTTRLQEGLHHVGYEISMLLWTIAQLEQPTQEDNQRNLLVEGMAIHARNLIIFFERWVEAKDTDYVVEDYFDGRPRLLNLGRQKDKADRQVAHLTTYRKTDEKASEKRWDPSEYRPLLDVCERFLKKIFDERPHLVREVDRPYLKATLAQLTKRLPLIANVSLTAGDGVTTYVSKVVVQTAIEIPGVVHPPLNFHTNPAPVGIPTGYFDPDPKTDKRPQRA